MIINISARRRRDWMASICGIISCGLWLQSCAISSAFDDPNKVAVTEAITVSFDAGNIVPSAQTSTVSKEQLARIAFQRSSLANIIDREMANRALPPHACERDVQNANIQNQFMKAISLRHRQESASQALKLHYGIAALIEGLQLLDITDSLVSEQIVAQEKLVESGVPITDPLQLQRLKIAIFDEALDKQSKLSTLRFQLASLVGNEIGCMYAPQEDMVLIPRDDDVCVWIQRADQCRPEIATLRSLRGSINVHTLETWDQIASLVTQSPAPVLSKIGILRPITSLLQIRDRQRDVLNRKSWVDSLIVDRSKTSDSEVEVAFERKKTAALRWVQSRELNAVWESRVQQLEQLADNKGNLAEQSEAKLELLRSRSPIIERWLDWHFADIDLRLAAGDNFQTDL